MLLKLACYLQYAHMINQKMVYIPPIQFYKNQDQNSLFNLIPQERKNEYLQKPEIIKSSDFILVFQTYSMYQSENGHLNSRNDEKKMSYFNRPIFMTFAIVYNIAEEKEIINDFNQCRNHLIEKSDEAEMEMFFKIKKSEDLKEIVGIVESSLKNPIRIKHPKKVISILILSLILLLGLNYYFKDFPKKNIGQNISNCSDIPTDSIDDIFRNLDCKKENKIDYNNEEYIKYFIELTNDKPCEEKANQEQDKQIKDKLEIGQETNQKNLTFCKKISCPLTEDNLTKDIFKKYTNWLEELDKTDNPYIEKDEQSNSDCKNKFHNLIETKDCAELLEKFGKENEEIKNKCEKCPSKTTNDLEQLLFKYSEWKKNWSTPSLIENCEKNNINDIRTALYSSLQKQTGCDTLLQNYRNIKKEIPNFSIEKEQVTQCIQRYHDYDKCKKYYIDFTKEIPDLEKPQTCIELCKNKSKNIEIENLLIKINKKIVEEISKNPDFEIEISKIEGYNNDLFLNNDFCMDGKNKYNKITEKIKNIDEDDEGYKSIMKEICKPLELQKLKYCRAVKKEASK